MIFKRTYSNSILKRHCFLFSVLIFSFVFQPKISAQEKVQYLKQRLDGTTEIITKNFTRTKLNILKNKFFRQGIIFNFSNLKYNPKKEIIKITLILKNKKSNCKITWEDENNTIPIIKTGESFGVVFASSDDEPLELKN